MIVALIALTFAVLSCMILIGTTGICKPRIKFFIDGKEIILCDRCNAWPCKCKNPYPSTESEEAGEV